MASVLRSITIPRSVKAMSCGLLVGGLLLVDGTVKLNAAGRQIEKEISLSPEVKQRLIAEREESEKHQKHDKRLWSSSSSGANQGASSLPQSRHGGKHGKTDSDETNSDEKTNGGGGRNEFNESWESSLSSRSNYNGNGSESERNNNSTGGSVWGRLSSWFGNASTSSTKQFSSENGETTSILDKLPNPNAIVSGFESGSAQSVRELPETIQRKWNTGVITVHKKVTNLFKDSD